MMQLSGGAEYGAFVEHRSAQYKNLDSKFVFVMVIAKTEYFFHHKIKRTL